MATRNLSSKIFRLMVNNVPWTVSDLELQKYFSQFGHVVRAKVFYDKTTGLSRYSGFLEVVDKDTYENIFNKQRHVLEGRVLTIRPSSEGETQYRNSQGALDDSNESSVL